MPVQIKLVGLECLCFEGSVSVISMLSVKPGREGSDGGNTELGESAALLLLEGQPVLERRGSIRWEPLKKNQLDIAQFPHTL